MDDSATNWRDHFEIPPGLLYFNSANLSYLPKVVRRAMAEHLTRFEANPTKGLRSAWEQLADIRDDLAQFVGTKPENLFLRSNVTSVLNAILMGIPLQPQDEILMGELEYGAIQNICLLRAKREGLTVRMVRFPTTRHALAAWSASQIISDLTGQIGPRTKLLLLSHVIGAYGLRLPIDEIGRICRERSVHLVVDGAYAVGAIPVDFRRLPHVDFYGCSLYKWMMGPKGTAFGYASSTGQKVLQPTLGGWKTFDASFAEKFSISGCHDFSPFFALKELLAFWRSIGEVKIQTRIAALDEKIRVGFQEIGITTLSPETNLRAPIVTAQLPQQVAEANPVHLGTGPHFAFSPHVYNTDDEVDNLLCEARRIKFLHS